MFNDDCISHVFRQLHSFRGHIRLSMINKQWNNVSYFWINCIPNYLCRKLIIFDLFNNIVSRYKNISFLNLSHTAISDSHIKLLLLSCRVDSLVLYGCSHLTDDSVTFLSQFRFHILDLCGCENICNDSIKLLSNCHVLHIGTPVLTDSGIPLPCHDLRRLYFTGSKITDLGLSRLLSSPSISSLNTLRLHSCKLITNVGLQFLPHAKHLLKLYVNYTNITDTCIPYIVQCTNLTSLFFKNCSISDSGLVLLTTLTNLNTLDLTQCKQISDHGIQSLAKLHNLSHLYLSFTNVSDSGLSPLSSCSNLRTLFLTNTNVTIHSVKLFTQCNSLDLSYTPINNSCLPFLTQCTNLNLASTRITDAFPPLTITHWRTLNLNNTHIADYGIAKLILTSPRLNRLSLSSLPASDNTIKLLTSCRHLNLHNTNITDHSIIFLCQFRNLRSLRLANTSITDKCILPLVNARAHYSCLNFNHTLITDIGVTLLATCSIDFLHLDCTNITDTSAKLLLLCQTIFLGHTHVTSECITLLRQKHIIVCS